jgi:hypothetical protein
MVDPWDGVDACVTECEGIRENFDSFDDRQAYDRRVACFADSSCTAIEEGQCEEEP